MKINDFKKIRYSIDHEYIISPEILKNQNNIACRMSSIIDQNPNLSDVSFQMVVRKAEESIGKTNTNFEIIAKNAESSRPLSIINRYSSL